MSPTFQARIVTGLFIVNTLLVIGGCKNSDSSQGAPSDDGAASKKAVTTKATASKNGEKHQKTSPPRTLYAGVDISALSPDERQMFVSIAKSELCPCPSATESLHECLQSKEASCSLARQIARTAVRGIQRSFSNTDILNQVAQDVEAASKTYEFDLKNAPVKGNPDASVVLVEFADFQCPHCKHAAEMIDDLVEEHGDKIAVYYKHFPLRGHGQSELAARASMAAKRQGRFWQMHDLLFEHQRSLSPGKIERFARRLGINATKFREDLNSPVIAQLVRSDKAEATKTNVRGTPALFINGKKYAGPKTAEAVSAALGLGGQASK